MPHGRVGADPEPGQVATVSSGPVRAQLGPELVDRGASLSAPATSCRSPGTTEEQPEQQTIDSQQNEANLCAPVTVGASFRLGDHTVQAGWKIKDSVSG